MLHGRHHEGRNTLASHRNRKNQQKSHGGSMAFCAEPRCPSSATFLDHAFLRNVHRLLRGGLHGDLAGQRAHF